MSKPELPRLPWEAHPEGGFIAYPEGKKQTGRYARLQPWTTGPNGAYQWFIRYDGIAINDVSGSKQAAADAATERWPRAVEMAAAAARRAAWEANQLEMIARAERGEIDPNYFANANADYENMMWVMERIKPKPGQGRVSAGIQRIVDAMSREFFRRRR